MSIEDDRRSYPEHVEESDAMNNRTKEGDEL